MRASSTWQEGQQCRKELPALLGGRGARPGHQLGTELGEYRNSHNEHKLSPGLHASMVGWSCGTKWQGAEGGV